MGDLITSKSRLTYKPASLTVIASLLALMHTQGAMFPDTYARTWVLKVETNERGREERKRTRKGPGQGLSLDHVHGTSKQA